MPWPMNRDTSIQLVTELLKSAAGGGGFDNDGSGIAGRGAGRSSWGA